MEDIKKNLPADNEENKELLKIIGDISTVAGFADNTIEMVIKSEESWLKTNFLKLFK